MVDVLQKSNKNRNLGKLISNSGFEKFFYQSTSSSFIEELKHILFGDKQPPNFYTVKELLDLSFSSIANDYRHEYFYKTKILNNFILKNYSLKNTIILNEFRIGKSKADLVLVNGKNKVFEIKTELDTPERLKTQLDDYYLGFSEVYVVTHESLAKKYLKLLDEKVGLIVFKDSNTIKILRSAQHDISKLSNISMMKCLKKSEFLNIIIKNFGTLPNTKPVYLYKECLDLVEQLPSNFLQRDFLNALKARIEKRDVTEQLKGVPEYLKFFFYTKKLKHKDYLTLPVRLSHRI